MGTSYFLAGQRATADLLNSMGMVGELLFRATRDTNQSIADSTAASTANAISWETINLDTISGWSAGQPTRYTPTVAGWYLCTGSVGFNASTAGTIRGAGWLVNGALPDVSSARPHVTTLANTTATAEARSAPFLFNGTTDYLELAGFQNTGGALNTATGSLRPFIAVYYVAPA